LNTDPDGLEPARREGVYRALKSRAARVGLNAESLARLLSSWSAGEGGLPDCLGLAPEEYRQLLDTFFPGAEPLEKSSRPSVDGQRLLEADDLHQLILSHAQRPQLPETRWIATILVAGCMGEDHLWQDLGLWTRADLSRLIAYNFPSLAMLNRADMKWKKFFYKKLCESEGIYVCRSPSCEACVDYADCFGSEE
jgi:nitrogen fixation protein NifQ